MKTTVHVLSGDLGKAFLICAGVMATLVWIWHVVSIAPKPIAILGQCVTRMNVPGYVVNVGHGTKCVAASLIDH